MKKFILGIMALSLMVLVGCSQQHSNKSVDNSKPIIEVNGSVITQKTFDDKLKTQLESSILGSQKIDLKDSKNKFIYLLFKDRVVNELIIRELLSQEIEKRNIKIDDKEINDTIEALSKQVGGKEKFEATLKKEGMTVDQFKETVKNDLKVKALVNSLAVTKVSDGDVKRFYEKNRKSKFTSPDSVRASHILISASEEDFRDKIKTEDPKLSNEEVNQKVNEEMAKTKAKTEKILKEVNADPTKFDQYAKKYSEDFSSAKNGGDLGFFGKEDMVKPFSDVAFKLKPDTISEIVKTQFGFHIIKVTDRKKAGVTPYSEVKGEIKKYLEDQNKVAVLQKFIDGLKTSAKINYLNKDYDPANIKKEIKKAAKESKGLINTKPVVKK
ncbi:MAG: peptidylprolyl isomerase [Candidatus Gastranaerophilaceae bacterium]|jgi:parvulin-like peptidyl-prolyl isomerase